jgi:hypothetical protein
MSPRINGEYIPAYGEEIEIPSDGHVFDENLNCICRELEGFFYEWRWRYTGRWLLFQTKVKKGKYRQELHRIKRTQRGKACGISWKDHQENPQPCIGCYSVGRKTRETLQLPTVLKCSTLRASKWSRLRAAAVLPHDAVRQSAWSGGKRLPPLVDP